MFCFQLPTPRAPRLLLLSTANLSPHAPFMFLLPSFIISPVHNRFRFVSFDCSGYIPARKQMSSGHTGTRQALGRRPGELGSTAGLPISYDYTGARASGVAEPGRGSLPSAPLAWFWQGRGAGFEVEGSVRRDTAPSTRFPPGRLSRRPAMRRSYRSHPSEPRATISHNCLIFPLLRFLWCVWNTAPRSAVYLSFVPPCPRPATSHARAAAEV